MVTIEGVAVTFMPPREGKMRVMICRNTTFRDLDVTLWYPR